VNSVHETSDTPAAKTLIFTGLDRRAGRPAGFEGQRATQWLGVLSGVRKVSSFFRVLQASIRYEVTGVAKVSLSAVR
jgi:hypothetical protein